MKENVKNAIILIAIIKMLGGLQLKELIRLLQEKIEKAFIDCGYDNKYGKVINSNRPDLCEFQCDGALSAAKEYKKAPIIIAEEVVEKCRDCEEFEKIEAIKPGFININISKSFLTRYCNMLLEENKFGCKMDENKTVVVDYGGPNVAKPLHVGHLRPAIIGESVKRIHKFFGNKVIGDVHLGDWGLQMGLVIEELKVRHPDWDYFNENFNGDYPEDDLFTVSDLEEIYPCASAKTKVSENASEDEIQKANEFKENARKNTAYLQEKKKGYYDLWKKIVEISVKDLKENYKKLDVDFDLWLGESDSQEYVKPMVEKMENLGIIYESDGAMVVDVQEPSDTITVNPCMVLKTGGVSCYQTTDLATIMQRQIDFNPDSIIYVVDKRQELHFVQVFRCARKAKLVDEKTDLIFLGFGTMNGKDGKPFKTRSGGVMRLENLINEVTQKVYEKMDSSKEIPEEEKLKISKIVGLAALKYADLSNQISKDYIFDIDKFTSFEGKTGPYILYTLVRIKSILNKFYENSNIKENRILNPIEDIEKQLLLIISKYNQILQESYIENAPSKICSYLYELADTFNSYYQKVKILQGDSERLDSNITLLSLMKNIFESGIELLGFEAPEKM